MTLIESLFECLECFAALALVAGAVGRLEGGEWVAWIDVVSFNLVALFECVTADGAVCSGGEYRLALLPVVRAVHGTLIGLPFWCVAGGVFALL